MKRPIPSLALSRQKTLWLLTLMLTGCASYAPLPLPQRPAAAQAQAALVVDPAQLPLARLAKHRFDPSDGLDIDEVAMLAVARNPQLRAARDGVGVARAQAFAAGLLPDPQLGFSSDHPTNPGAGNTNAVNLNLAYDATAWLARSSRRAAAQADVHKVRLDLLWQEWQVVSRARLLFTRLQSEQQLLTVLHQAQALWRDSEQRQSLALAQGNATLDTASAALAALQAAQRQTDDLELRRLKDCAALHALLGLGTAQPLTLVGEPRATLPKPERVRAELAARLSARPDLQALRAGYASQEARFRAAVLAQFPALNVGLTRARDTSGLYTLGFSLGLSLPLLDANRGNIAIERATRQRLFDDYRQRLDAAQAEVETALENLPLLQAQLERTRAGAAAMLTLAQRADAAWRAGELTSADHVRFVTTWTDKRVEAIQLAEAVMEQRIALETLLGPDLAAAPDPKEH